jgi:hypothetical protein
LGQKRGVFEAELALLDILGKFRPLEKLRGGLFSLGAKLIDDLLRAAFLFKKIALRLSNAAG